MTALGLILALILLALTVLHLLWAGRVWWPLDDEAALARTVAGFPGLTRMPPAPACLAVAVVLGALALLALTLAGLVAIAPPPIAALAGTLASGGFVLRGVAAWLPRWARLTPQEPFRSLDRAAYGPLCLTLGAGFAILTAGAF